jgi:hypothetical protein
MNLLRWLCLAFLFWGHLPPTDSIPHLVWSDSQLTSEFPNGALFSLRASAPSGILQARLHLTLDGAVFYAQDALVPPHAEGESVLIQARWNGLSLSRDPSPPWMPLQYWWSIADKTGQIITTPPQQALYSDPWRRPWQTKAGVHVDVYTYEQGRAFIDDVVAYGDSAVAQLRAGYGYDLPYRPAIVVYNSAEEGDTDFGVGERAPFGSFVVGRAYPGTSGVALLARPDRAYLQRVITHELAHLYQYQIGVQLFEAPHWWIEGDAKAKEPSASQERSLTYARRVALEGRLPALATWDSRNYTSESDLDHALKIGASFVLYLREIYGAGALAYFYQTWRTGGDFRAAFPQAFNASLESLSQAWGAWLTSQERLALSPPNSLTPDIPATLLQPLPEGMARVNAFWLNFRAAPSTEADVIAVLTVGQLLLPLGRNEEATWLLVELPDGSQGWLYREFVDYEGDFEALTVSFYPKDEANNGR